MPPHRAPPRRALRYDGPHVVRRDLVQERVLHEEREHGERPRHVAGHRQRHVPGAVDEPRPPAGLHVEVGRQPAYREGVGEAVHRAAERHLEQHRQRERRDRVGDEHHERRDRVERLPVPQRLHYAERDADEVREDERRHAEPDRHRDPRAYELPRRLVGVVVARQAHAHAVDDEPVPVLPQDRLVEAELRLKLPAVLVRHAARRCRGRGRLARRSALGGESAHAHHAHLHRPARQEAREREADDGDPDERGDRQQQTPSQIRQLVHVPWPILPDAPPRA